MRSERQLGRALGVVCSALLLMACSGPTPSPSETAPPGGTVRIGIPPVGPDTFPDTVRAWLDPGFEIVPYFRRCCTARTLVGYNVARPGGSGVLEPDLAAELPAVSPDGLTWTFRLRPGLRYAPPFQEVEITAADFVRAIERSIVTEVLFIRVQGIDEFVEDPSGGLAGLQTPDEHTLVVKLSEPDGDLPHRLAEPGAAPIPDAALENERLVDFVSSGPYMVESVDADGAALVRNPSWSKAIDQLRPAYVDRIELLPVESESDGLRKIEAGTLDLITTWLGPDDYRRALRDGEVSRIISTQANASFFVPLNIANPPLDDVHVRRALALLIDRAGIADVLQPGRGSFFEVADHILPDVSVRGLLSGYDPLAQAAETGSVAAAQAEMRMSRYDTDGDGRCDHRACDRIVIMPLFDEGAAADQIARQLPELGMTPVVQPLGSERSPDPRTYHLVAILGWVAIGPTPSDYHPIISSVGLPSDDQPFAANYALLGASRSQLRHWGYSGNVPSLDEEVQFCLERRGSSALRCWAEVDQLLMEQLVPMIPIATGFAAYRVSDRVAAVEMSPTEVAPALDTLQVMDDAAPPG